MVRLFWGPNDSGNNKDTVSWTISLIVTLPAWYKPVSAWSPGGDKLTSHCVTPPYVSPLCGTCTALFCKSDLSALCILEGQAQDTKRLRTLAYQFLILSFSDFRTLSNAGMADRLPVTYTSSCSVVMVGNTVLSKGLTSGLSWKDCGTNQWCHLWAEAGVRVIV